MVVFIVRHCALSRKVVEGHENLLCFQCRALSSLEWFWHVHNAADNALNMYVCGVGFCVLCRRSTTNQELWPQTVLRSLCTGASFWLLEYNFGRKLFGWRILSSLFLSLSLCSVRTFSFYLCLLFLVAARTHSRVPLCRWLELKTGSFVNCQEL